MLLYFVQKFSTYIDNIWQAVKYGKDLQAIEANEATSSQRINWRIINATVFILFWLSLSLLTLIRFVALAPLLILLLFPILILQLKDLLIRIYAISIQYKKFLKYGINDWKVRTPVTVPSDTVITEKILRDLYAKEFFSRPHKYSSTCIDKLFIGLVWTLRLIYDSRKETFKSHLDRFRYFLAHEPPIRLLKSNDSFYVVESNESSMNIMTLYLLERIDLEQLRQLTLTRFVSMDPKTRSVLTKVCGRLCWKALSLPKELLRRGNLLIDDNTPEIINEESDACFDISQHVFEIPIDLKEDIIFDKISEASSKIMDRSKPLWEYTLFNPINDDVQIESSYFKSQKSMSSTDDMEPIIRLKASECSLLMLRTHHLLGDGTGVALAITNNADPISETEVEELQKLKGKAISEIFENTDKFIIPSLTETNPFLPVRRADKIRGNTVDLKETGGIRGWKLFPVILYHLIFGFARTVGCLAYLNITPIVRSLLKQTQIETSSRVTGKRKVSRPIEYKMKTLIDMNEEIGFLLGGTKPTLNEFIIYCLATALNKLKDPLILQGVLNRIAKADNDVLARTCFKSAQTADHSSSPSTQSSEAGQDDEDKTANIGLPGIDSSEYLRIIERLKSHPLAKFMPQKVGQGEHGNLNIFQTMSVRFDLPNSMDNNITGYIEMIPFADALNVQLQHEAHDGKPSTSRRLINYLSGYQLCRKYWREVALLTLDETTPSTRLIKRLRHLHLVRACLQDIKRKSIRMMTYTLLWFCTMFISYEMTAEFIRTSLTRAHVRNSLDCSTNVNSLVNV